MRTLVPIQYSNHLLSFCGLTPFASKVMNILSYALAVFYKYKTFNKNDQLCQLARLIVSGEYLKLIKSVPQNPVIGD